MFQDQFSTFGVPPTLLASPPVSAARSPSSLTLRVSQGPRTQCFSCFSLYTHGPPLLDSHKHEDFKAIVMC